jgi:protein involved in polysaccharide export with SLBB domain
MGKYLNPHVENGLLTDRKRNREMTTGRRCIAAILCVAFLTAVLDLPALAQTAFTPDSYRVGVGDRIFISVDQRPDLNRELVIEEGGAVTLPLIGEVTVAGLSIKEMEQKLLLALQDYYPSVNRIEITIREAISQVIYITGQVGAPGKYNFHKAPNLWEAIREAGGGGQGASLESVRVVKDRTKGGRSTEYNVQRALETGSIEDLPDLEAGDTVIVPAVAESYTGSFGVNLFGHVVIPGTYKLQGAQDLVTAILQAGGPTPAASLEKVNIIRAHPDGSIATITVNFANFLEFGDPYSNPKLKPGDTVYLPRKGAFEQLTTAELRLILTLVTATLSAVLVILAISDRYRD